MSDVQVVLSCRTHQVAAGILAIHEILNKDVTEDLGSNVYENYFWLLDELLEIYPEVAAELPQQAGSAEVRMAAILDNKDKNT